jgi:hypothetical protein
MVGNSKAVQKVLHRTAIPLRSIDAGELERSQKLPTRVGREAVYA